MNVGVVIVCAGKGKRLGNPDKAILKLRDEPLFSYAVGTFAKIKEVKQIVLVLSKRHLSIVQELIKDKRVTLIEGGRHRRDSVYNGLCALDRKIQHVLIHDGARPFVSRGVIQCILKALKKHPAVICGIKTRDTLKVINSQRVVKKTLNRDGVVSIQTPQGFRKDLIIEAYRRAPKAPVTDDAQLVERMGEAVKVIEGDILNFKITYPEDVCFAERLATIAK
ncbi:MAG: 2-C-methyl-D-erythritol 4-phosphate cytidylyltransferase [Candidatus Omnitrophota bacterium]|nr:MAG: 2-C-methyl-D-erythritol 4-phosphate cytidylyltransferase [Candidatus Omnitrophota bacterium]